MADFDYGSKKEDGQYQNHPAGPQELPLIQTIRKKYVHNTCGAVTSMPDHCAKTYAQNPKFYGSTFCCNCRDYFPVSEFVWEDCKKPIGEPTG